MAGRSQACDVAELKLFLRAGAELGISALWGAVGTIVDSSLRAPAAGVGFDRHVLERFQAPMGA